MTSRPTSTPTATRNAFTQEQHLIWQTLYTRQLPKVKRFACQDYLDGLEILDLPPDHLPTIDDLNSKITPRTTWKTVRTTVRYSDAVPWYQHFARREFLVTDYMRGWHELDFTPEPDMFHDIFGHLPFMVQPHYTSLQEIFAPAFLRANQEQRENIKRLAWFSTEFGLIRQNGELKVFGAGLISSYGEMEHVMSGEVPITPFTVENVINHDKAIWSFNQTLFVFDSIDALKRELNRYFATI